MDGRAPTVLHSCRSAEDRGKLIHDTIGPGLQLMHQVVRVGQLSLTLVVPADVDAVMDMYIDRGEELGLTAQQGSVMAACRWQEDHPACQQASRSQGFASSLFLTRPLCRVQARRSGTPTGAAHGLRQSPWQSGCSSALSSSGASASQTWGQGWGSLGLRQRWQVRLGGGGRLEVEVL